MISGGRRRLDKVTKLEQLRSIRLYGHIDLVELPH